MKRREIRQSEWRRRIPLLVALVALCLVLVYVGLLDTRRGPPQRAADRTLRGDGPEPVQRVQQPVEPEPPTTACSPFVGLDFPEIDRDTDLHGLVTTEDGTPIGGALARAVYLSLPKTQKSAQDQASWPVSDAIVPSPLRQ